jgi:hypothetical protein
VQELVLGAMLGVRFFRFSGFIAETVRAVLAALFRHCAVFCDWRCGAGNNPE